MIMSKANESDLTAQQFSSTGDSKKSSTRRPAWNWSPDGPIEIYPLFSWPPKPFKTLKWLVTSYLAFSSPVLILMMTLVTWFFLTPALAEMAQLRPGWVLLIYARNLGLMFAVAGGLHLYFYIWRKQGDRLKFDRREMARGNRVFKFNDQVLDNMYWTLLYGVTLWSAYEVLFFWAAANQWIPLMFWSDHPVWFVLLLVLIPVWSSFHFYWTHRFLHWKPVYRTVHSRHHTNVNVGPWSGLSMHPVEILIYFSSVLIHLVVASSPFHMLYHMQYLTFNAVTSHTGYDSLLVRERKLVPLGRFHHQLHHRYFECNYGNLYIPFDKWFGSFHDGTPQAHKKIFG